ncbi:ribokinase [Mordavella massiliensis]|uniref:Ribokinase n=1 Tax=Mordavella massiliensis TaxID=1871024 RepID=A0A938XCE0_9CLOT|nr:ribokinase [Mordavella massiliensis]MBM6949229.1 ribokinase [Mordavella massiliensis]
MTEKKVLVYGSLNLDHVYSVDHFAGPGETIPARDMKVSCGGKGLNQAVAFAKAGAQTYLAGKTGSGGDLLRDTCREYGVHTDYLKSCSEPGGHAVIQVDAQGQNSIIIFGGTNRMQTEEEISRVLEQFDGGDFLILQNEINNLPYLIQRAHERGMEIVLNPSPWEESLRSCGLEQVSWLILNEVEAFQMTGEQEPEAVLDQFRRMYPDMKIVLTLGEDGSMCQSSGLCLSAPCVRTRAVDTTAAGDTFTGYFFAEILRGRTEEQALRTASQVAAITVSRRGAAAAIPYLREVLDEQERN